MTKEQYFELKKELKELASTIRSQKYYYKDKQRIQSKVEVELSKTDMLMYRYKNNKWHLASGESCSAQSDLLQYQFNYRVNHIFYCLLRSSTREQIENNFGKIDKTDVIFSNVISKIEDQLVKLCKQYELEYDTDLVIDNCGLPFIISIDRPWIKTRIEKVS